MHDQRKPTPAEDDARVDGAILRLLLDADARGPWAVEEVARQIGDRVSTVDSLARLHGAGLIHRIDGFVFASRAAIECDALDA
jgi:hypothetical protein